MVKDIYERFKRDISKRQERRETDIPVGVEIEEDMSFSRSQSRGSTTEELNMVLYGYEVEANNCWR